MCVLRAVSEEKSPQAHGPKIGIILGIKFKVAPLSHTSIPSRCWSVWGPLVGLVSRLGLVGSRQASRYLSFVTDCTTRSVLPGKLSPLSPRAHIALGER